MAPNASALNPYGSGSRGRREGGIEALMVVYRLADQSIGIPLDDGREPGRPEGLVEFAPANDAVIGDELEKVIVTPSGIAGQRFDPLDFHGSCLSLLVGFLETASQSLFLSTQPLVCAWTSASAMLWGVPSRSKRLRRSATPGWCPRKVSVGVVEILGLHPVLILTAGSVRLIHSTPGKGSSPKFAFRGFCELWVQVLGSSCETFEV
jgi:hypothetical protein